MYSTGICFMVSMDYTTRKQTDEFSPKRRGRIIIFVMAFVTICYTFYKVYGDHWASSSLGIGDLVTRGTPLLPTRGTLSATGTFSKTGSSDNYVSGRENLYQKRRLDVKEHCMNMNRTLEKYSVMKSPYLLFERKRLIYYCPIPKVCSSFWKRVLTVLGSGGKLKSPFEIHLRSVNLSDWTKLSMYERENFIKRGNSFMFVRDPYARLFSGYENKIYHPNSRYWKSIGKKVIEVVRKNNEKRYRNYGFDVTFPEFVKYIIYLHETGRKINPHFSLMSTRCDPCATHFKYIGKLETFVVDAMYLISKWQHEFIDFNLRFDDFEKETAIDTATGHVRLLFETKSKLKEIKFPFIKLMLRSWRDLQIRGHLSKYINFPINKTHADKVTNEEYVNEIRKALEIPVNRTEVKLQRDEALIQAYRQVPLEDMEKIRKYLLEDCLLFGYDDRPKKLFDRSQPIDENFLYLDGLKDN